MPDERAKAGTDEAAPTHPTRAPLAVNPGANAAGHLHSLENQP